VSRDGTTPKYQWSQLLPVLEGVVWAILVVTAFGSTIVIGILVDIDCNGLFGDRPDQACENSKSWMAGIPIGVLALLVVARVKLHQRTTGRRGALGAGR
jgi:hypothetical protein